MSTSQRRAGLLVVALVMFALAGCQATPGGFPIPTLDPTGSSAADPTPSPTETVGDLDEIPVPDPVTDAPGAHFGPTDAAPARTPDTRVRSTCAQLISDPRNDDLLGGDPVLVASTGMLTPRDAALQQAGILQCYSAYAPTPAILEWVVGPSDQTQPGVPEHDGCSGFPYAGSCYFTAERGGYRVDGYVDTRWTDFSYDVGDLYEDYQSFGSSVLDTLTAPGSPRAAWQPTETGRTTGCAPFDEDGTIREAVNISGPVYAVSHYDYVNHDDFYQFPYFAEATYAQGWQHCQWDSDADPLFTIQYTPGSSWAWGLFDRGGLSSVSVPGAREAYGACTSSGCVLHVLASQTWIMATIEPTNSGLSRLAAGVAALIPLMPLDEA